MPVGAERWQNRVKNMSFQCTAETTGPSPVAVINSMVGSHAPETERQRLEARYGRVWSPSELRRKFLILGFSAPQVMVRRRFDGVKGRLEFQHRPRYYFHWVDLE